MAKIVGRTFNKRKDKSIDLVIDVDIEEEQIIFNSTTEGEDIYLSVDKKQLKEFLFGK